MVYKSIRREWVVVGKNFFVENEDLWRKKRESNCLVRKKFPSVDIDVVSSSPAFHCSDLGLSFFLLFPVRSNEQNFFSRVVDTSTGLFCRDAARNMYLKQD